MSDFFSGELTLLSPQPKAAHQFQSAENVLIGRDAETLQLIGKPGIAAAVWQRTPDPAFQAWIDGLAADALPELRTIVPIDRVQEAVQTACDVKRLPIGRERDMLAGDISALAFILSKIMGVGSVQLRLDVDDEVMCPKFHIDNVAARLLCTYRGPATQYVAASKQGNSDLVGQMTTGSVGLFRGKQWPSEEASELLHRSPQITHGSAVRMLLVIDPVI